MGGKQPSQLEESYCLRTPTNKQQQDQACKASSPFPSSDELPSSPLLLLSLASPKSGACRRAMAAAWASGKLADEVTSAKFHLGL